MSTIEAVYQRRNGHHGDGAQHDAAGAEMAPRLEMARNALQLRTNSERVERLHDRVRQRMTQPQSVWGEKLDIFSEPGVAGLPLVLRRARALAMVLEQMPIAIEKDDIIVGNTMQDGVIVRTGLPPYGTADEYAGARIEGTSLSAHLSHKTPYYYDAVAKGLVSMLAEVEGKIAACQTQPLSSEREEKLALFQAMIWEMEAVIALAHRYADLADALAQQAATAHQRDELAQIAGICRRVPQYPAQTFQEAVQSFWFIHYALFSTGTNLSCGRFDQYLYPFLQRELTAGTITLDRAQEIVDAVWLRFNDRGQICRDTFFTAAGEEPAATIGPDRPGKRRTIVDTGPQSWTAGHRKRFRYAADAADAINHFGQNILLSGIRPDGSDGTNPLTYLCLNALEKFAFTSPVVTLRLHRDSEQQLVVRAAEVLKAGGGMPYINNDDVLVAAYVDLGVPLADARDYANSNCWETMIEGKSDQELIRGMNFLLFLELALHGGSPKSMAGWARIAVTHAALPPLTS